MLNNIFIILLTGIYVVPIEIEINTVISKTQKTTVNIKNVLFCFFIYLSHSFLGLQKLLSEYNQYLLLIEQHILFFHLLFPDNGHQKQKSKEHLNYKPSVIFFLMDIFPVRA